MYLETSAYVLKDRITMDATTVRLTNRPKRPRGKKKSDSSLKIQDVFRFWPI